MSWSLFGALSSIIKKEVGKIEGGDAPDAIRKLLYHTEDEIDNLVQSESDMEVISGSKKALDELFGNLMNGNYLYDASYWVDKAIFTRSKLTGKENILTEDNWKQNLNFDQIKDDETLM